MPPEPAEPTTRSNAVFDQLRADLLAGRLTPGSKLKLAVLGRRCTASLSVVREALSRLAEQGLVVAHPQRGFSVVALSPEDLADLTATRIDLETLAARRSVERGDLAWETALVAAHHMLAGTPAATPEGEVNEEWITAHRAFHEALIAGCGSRRLQGMTSALRDSAELYRIWSESLTHDHARDIAGEHSTLLSLAIGRDADGLADALAAHIQQTTDVLLRYAAHTGTGGA
ncbi:FCD domain-containing protein [Streptomyces sp. NPDC008150]|uniref:GntR family transcriptional regulator n=1 Tax=Streptomyces sp. NPDC008150 TaxID=3364816 RepID=UPI0036E8F0A3